MADPFQDAAGDVAHMPDAQEARLKRLYFRSWHRGFKEADLMLGHFADTHLRRLSPDQLDRYEALIGELDHDLYNWISGRSPIPAEHDHDVMALLRSGDHLQHIWPREGEPADHSA